MKLTGARKMPPAFLRKKAVQSGGPDEGRESAAYRAMEAAQPEKPAGKGKKKPFGGHRAPPFGGR